MKDDAGIDPLLSSVADGEPVDWDLAESQTSTAEARLRLRALRDVSRVAEFHHALQHDAEADAPRAEFERWGHLLLLERVRAGAGGELFRAWDPVLQREVALKLLHAPVEGAEAPANGLEEARVLARVRDPHVVVVFGAADHEGRPGLWMEFLRGPTLEEVIARRGPLPAPEVARLGAQLARALGAVHASDTVHRDVKPANIVLEADGRAVLTDFGLGQRHSVAHDARPFSGTPLFMSPQRLAGATAKATDDLYALGVTLHCALAGAAPFQAASLEQLRAAQDAGPERSLAALRPDAPPALVAAIERAMAPEAALRFPSAQAMAAAFEAALAAPVAAARPSRVARAGQVVAGLALAAALAWLALGRGPHRGPATLPSAAPAPVVGGYDVSAGFLRRSPTGDVPLVSGDRIAPGDHLSLRFRSTRPMWVYVLDADEHGESYLLFPQPMFDLRNPVPANSVTVLPGTRRGRENAWTVTSRGGREHLLVVAGPGPVAELETELARLPAPVPGRPVQYARVEAQAMERLRGLGGVSDLPAAAPRPDVASLFDRIRALAGSEQAVRGTWVRQIVLENPSR